jgi:hypothetical protein
MIEWESGTSFEMVIISLPKKLFVYPLIKIEQLFSDIK